MVESGDRPRLVHEPATHFRVALERGRQDLDGHAAAERGVRCEIDLSHAAPTEQADDLVPADALGKWFRGHRAASIGGIRGPDQTGGGAARSRVSVIVQALPWSHDMRARHDRSNTRSMRSLPFRTSASKIVM